MSEGIETFNAAKAIMEGGASTAPALVKEETPQIEKPTENAKDISREFAALTRKQKEIYLKEKELKEREARFKEIDSLEALKDTDPLEYLTKKGLKFDDIVQKVLKQGEEPTSDDKISLLEKRIEAMVKAQEDKERAREEEFKKSKADADEKAIANFREKIKNDLSSDMDKYEFINHEGAFDTVFEVIEEKWLQDKTKPLMSVSEAADLVEKHFEDKYLKAMTLKKLGNKPATEARFQDAVQTESVPAPTLKSNMTPSSTNSSKDHLTFEDRIEEAKKLMRSQGYR